MTDSIKYGHKFMLYVLAANDQTSTSLKDGDQVMITTSRGVVYCI
jgi:hypothetical protein